VGEGTFTSRTLDEIEEHLMGVYVDKIGVEFMHSPVKSERL
jgi:probable 2-oxoglutarate dehydrogenase E1 component DHKTD1